MTRPLRLALIAALLALPAAAQTPAPEPAAPPAPPTGSPLEQALRNFPAQIVGANVHATLANNDVAPRSCPPPGARVDTRGGPSFEYLGAKPDEPDLCLMKIGGEPVEAWYGIWLNTWPGADLARRGLQRIMRSRTGDVVGFDVVIPANTPPGFPGAAYHDLIRQDGVEDITLLGVTYKALKLAHYREGFDGNTYRSVSTVWKDIATGMLIYGTYNHIAGRPEIDDPLIPTAIVPAP